MEYLIFSNRGCGDYCKKEDLALGVLKKNQPRYVFFPFWSWKIPPEIYTNFECIIFHTADLPKGRGSHPLQNLILRGVKKTKICALRCEEEIDAGPIYCKRDIDISYGTADEIYDRISAIIYDDMIPYILAHNPFPQPQVGKPTYFEKIGTKNIADFIRMLQTDYEDIGPPCWQEISR